MSDTDGTTSAPQEGPGPPPDPSTLLPWPPPGLARVQGDLSTAARKMTFAGGVLVLPLVAVLALPQSPYGLGPLGNAWWVALVTTVVGVGLFADASVTVVRMLLRVRRTLGQGYPWYVVGLVVSDAGRDNGHLMQGAHAYSQMSEAERRGVATVRLWSALSYLAASTWLPVSFGLLLLIAARGGASLRGVLLWTLAPTMLLATVGLVLAAVDGTFMRRSRKAWFNQPWASDLQEREIGDWRRAGAERGLIDGAKGVTPPWLLPATVGLVVLSLLAVLPSVTLVPASSMGAVLGSITGFAYPASQRRMAEAEAYRAMALEPDPSVTAAEAGELLHVIAMAGPEGDDLDALIRPPARAHDEPWTPEGAPEGFNPGDPEAWSVEVWTWLDRGLTAEERSFLERAAEHPARGDFSRLARAAGLDEISSRYTLPFPEDLTYFDLPWIPWTPVRSAANTHVALAALHSASGRHAEARLAAREAISVGVLLMDESNTLIGNLIGARIAKQGGQALTHAIRRAGDAEAARLLEAGAEGALLAASRIRAPYRTGAWVSQASLLEMPEVVLDPERPRGLRWEYAHIVPVVTACLNLRRVVFGPGSEHEAWVADVRESLVRNESEEALFDLAMDGMTVSDEPGAIGRLLAFTMGGSEQPGSCGHVVAHLPGSM